MVVTHESSAVRISRLDDLAGVVLLLVYPQRAGGVDVESLRAELRRALRGITPGSTVAVDLGSIDMRHLGATALIHDLDRDANARDLEVRWRIGDGRLAPR
jgi:hypothetical protein